MKAVAHVSIQITEAIKRYGVSDATTALFVVSISPLDGLETEVKMKTVVTGDLVPLGDLARLTNWSSVRKVLPVSCSLNR
jgi:EKC/KEOPS complex subunit CGI121/TPRKB